MFNANLRKSLVNLGSVKIETMSLKEQFEVLLLTPLSAIPPGEAGNKTRIIVIDALDECDRYDHISPVLKLLSRLRELRTIRLRVFLTSRSAPPIVNAFNNLNKHPGAYQSLTLGDDFNGETKDDISAFLRATFANIKTQSEVTENPWPDPEDLDRLVDLATNPSPLFIYASTLCRFVYDGEDEWVDPTERLKLWLTKCDSNASQLNQIYEPILEDSFSGRSKRGEIGNPLNSGHRPQVMQILGTIVLLATPLPATALAVLLGTHKDIVNRYLRNLHAVLNVPINPNTPVRVLHKSFSDFLLGQEETGSATFRVNAAEIHKTLSSKCIQRMKKYDDGLRKDICNVKEPGKSRAEIDKAIITCNIPPDLGYSCLYWVYHLQHSGRRITDEDKVYTFLYTHFLHWLEALSLIGRIPEAIGMIDSLLTIVEVRCLPASRPNIC